MGSSSYLYGTFHSRDARAFRFQDSVLVAFDACDIVAGELEVNEARKLDAAVTNAMLLPSGGSLDRLYNKRDYRRVIGALKERLGPLAPMCTKLRPFYTVAMLSEMSLGNDSSVVLDAWFQQRAEAMGKQVIGLEQLSEQLAAVERIPMRDQARLLFELVTRDKGQAVQDEALAVYSRCDLDGLMSLVGRDGLPEHADKALLEERNTRMAERLSGRMTGRHRVFAAVGAAHLAGDHGMLSILRARGFHVRPVAPLPGIAPPLKGGIPERTAVRELPPAIVLKKGVRVRNDTLGYALDMPVPPTKLVEQEDDTLRVVTWTASTPDQRFTVRVTTSEGKAIERTDARTRIEALREGTADPVDTASALTRIDGAQAFVSGRMTDGADLERRITVATPGRTHVFVVSNTGERSQRLVDQVVRSIRITESGAAPEPVKGPSSK